MQLVNKTKAVVNYGGKIIPPGGSFTIAAEHAELPGVVAMLGAGTLEASIGGEKPEGGKPSAGLNVEQLKAALTEKGAAFDPTAKKADLAALLDAAE